MRILFIACFLACSLAACGGSSSPQPDAAASHDAAGSGSAGACTGAAFDPCTDNSQCMSGNCHTYTLAGIQVCTTTCTPNDNSTCPTDSTGANAFCNSMGLCKPAAANTCTR
jgi:hypothetical protein